MMETHLDSNSEIVRLIHSLEQSLERIGRDLEEPREIMNGNIGVRIDSKGLSYIIILENTGIKSVVPKNKLSRTQRLSLLSIAGKQLLKEILSPS